MTFVYCSGADLHLLVNPLRTKLILILHFLHISSHTLISNASLHHWLQGYLY